jgi:elongation factor G
MDAGVVTAQVPMSEMLTFAPVLKSATSGRGSYHMEFSHYDEVPAVAAQKIIDAAKKPVEEEESEE